MNDPLKKYIENNRDNFDTLEPSPAVFHRLKSELKEASPEKKGMMRLIITYKWVVAASVLLLFSITYLLVSKNQNQLVSTPQVVKNTASSSTNAIVKNALEIEKTTPKVAVVHYKKHNKSLNILAAYHDLTDSTSASTRLAAILRIQKSNNMSYDLIDKMAKTLNHDSNSNVRLAALNLMSKYAQDSYVNNAFMLALSNQKDPLLQLALMELLGQTDNPKLDDKLYALANDPTTLSEVKNQAYFILLNQNKL